MTPRALVESGRKGIGREVFPETAKEAGRRVGLTPGLVTVLRYETTSDGGGDVTKGWIPDPEPIRGRIQSVRRIPRSQLIAGRISEEVTHLIWVDPDISITTSDRVRINEEDFDVLAVEPDTAGAFLRLEAKVL